MLLMIKRGMTMQARIKRIATEAEVKASSIRSHKNAEGEIFVGKWCAIFALDGVNVMFLQKCTPREMAIARYWGLFRHQGEFNGLTRSGEVEVINRIFRMTDIFVEYPESRREWRELAQEYKDKKTTAMQNYKASPDSRQQQSARDYGNSLANANKTPIDPPLKPLGEWIPPKPTLWQKILMWFGNDTKLVESLRDALKQSQILAGNHHRGKMIAERAFISVARPRYMNNSLPPNDRDLYEALCDFHGEEKLDEVPF